MLEREIAAKILEYSTKFPIVTIMGPRQSGKTTLAKHLFSEKKYVSLEDLDNREFALNDPRGFLYEYHEGAIIDEAQRVPSLFSYLQTKVDQDDVMGQYILTGSQQFEISNNISQSLAGRTAIAKLLPFSYQEIYKDKNISIENLLYTGFYPRIFDKNISPTDMMSFYTATYLERDVRNLLKIQELAKFEIFIKICAGLTGQIVNLSNISNQCGISHNTVTSWLKILEASFIIKLLPPFSRNINKRLIKAKKLYFLDSALASFLLGISSPEQLKQHPLKGSLFESFVISEALKSRYNNGRNDNLYYYRDSNGSEIDLIFDNGTSLDLIEIKLSQTITDRFLKNLNDFPNINNISTSKSLVYSGRNIKSYQGCQVYNWKSLNFLNQL